MSSSDNGNADPTEAATVAMRRDDDDDDAHTPEEARAAAVAPPPNGGGGGGRRRGTDKHYSVDDDDDDDEDSSFASSPPPPPPPSRVLAAPHRRHPAGSEEEVTRGDEDADDDASPSDALLALDGEGEGNGNGNDNDNDNNEDGIGPPNPARTTASGPSGLLSGNGAAASGGYHSSGIIDQFPDEEDSEPPPPPDYYYPATAASMLETTKGSIPMGYGGKDDDGRRLRRRRPAGIEEFHDDDDDDDHGYGPPRPSLVVAVDHDPEYDAALAEKVGRADMDRARLNLVDDDDDDGPPRPFAIRKDDYYGDAMNRKMMPPMPMADDPGYGPPRPFVIPTDDNDNDENAMNRRQPQPAKDYYYPDEECGDKDDAGEEGTADITSTAPTTASMTPGADSGEGDVDGNAEGELELPQAELVGDDEETGPLYLAQEVVRSDDDNDRSRRGRRRGRGRVGPVAISAAWCLTFAAALGIYFGLFHDGNGDCGSSSEIRDDDASAPTNSPTLSPPPMNCTAKYLGPIYDADCEYGSHRVGRYGDTTLVAIRGPELLFLSVHDNDNNNEDDGALVVTATHRPDGYYVVETVAFSDGSYFAGSPDFMTGYSVFVGPMDDDALSSGGGMMNHTTQISPEGWPQDFGTSVAAHGDVLVVGAPNDLDGAGSAFVYRRRLWENGTTSWTEEAKLSTPPPDDDDNGDGSVGVNNFGGSVLVRDDHVILVAADHHGNASQGAVFSFGYDPSSGSWEPTVAYGGGGGRIENADCDGRFGASIAFVSAHGLLIGCPMEDDARGAVYYYARFGMGYVLMQKITPRDGGRVLERFGRRLAANSRGDVVAIGTEEEEGGLRRQRVHVLAEFDYVWKGVATIDAPGAGIRNFGINVAIISGDEIGDSGRVLIAAGENIYSYALDCREGNDSSATGPPSASAALISPSPSTMPSTTPAIICHSIKIAVVQNRSDLNSTSWELQKIDANGNATLLKVLLDADESLCLPQGEYKFTMYGGGHYNITAPNSSLIGEGSGVEEAESTTFFLPIAVVQAPPAGPSLSHAPSLSGSPSASISPQPSTASLFIQSLSQPTSMPSTSLAPTQSQPPSSSMSPSYMPSNSQMPSLNYTTTSLSSPSPVPPESSSGAASVSLPRTGMCVQMIEIIVNHNGLSEVSWELRKIVAFGEEDVVLASHATTDGNITSYPQLACLPEGDYAFATYYHSDSESSSFSVGGGGNYSVFLRGGELIARGSFGDDDASVFSIPYIPSPSLTPNVSDASSIAQSSVVPSILMPIVSDAPSISHSSASPSSTPSVVPSITSQETSILTAIRKRHRSRITED